MSSEKFYLYFMDTQRNVGPFSCYERERVFSLLKKTEIIFMRFNNSLSSRQIEDMVIQRQHGAVAYNYEGQSMDFASVEEYYSVEGITSCAFMLVNLIK